MRQQDKEYTRESMHKREGINWYERRHGDPVRYAEIRGFFRSNVGRPWDHVFSDFCRKYDIRTAAGRYARQAVDWLVERNPDVDHEGNPLVRYRYSYRDHFYVHPRTGILRKVKVATHRYKVKPLDEQIIMLGKRAFFKFDEIWYEVLFKELPAKPDEDNVQARIRGFYKFYGVFDIFEARGRNKSYHFPKYSFASYHTFERHYIAKYGKPIYCYDKRQVGKKDIKRINEYIRKYSKKDK